MSPIQTPTAIVHEWVTARAGSELCFERLAALFPRADLYCLAADPDVDIETQGRPIHTTTLDRACRSPRGRQILLPAMPLAYRALRSRDYDLVISSSHAFSRAFAPPHALHLSYTYTPMRYAWYPETDGRNVGDSGLVRGARSVLRQIDKHLVRAVDSFAGISTEVVRRIQDCYDQPARLIHPPCDTEYFHPSDADDETAWDRPNEPFLLSVGRLIPYKRHDLVIAVAERLQMPVVIAGTGPESGRLRELGRRSRVPVSFEERAGRDRIRELYRAAAVTVFPPHEDFGIVPVESMACGTPVVGLAAGGALDTIGPAGGRLAAEQTVESLAETTLEVLYDPPSTAECRHQAERFSQDAFDRAVLDWVDSARSAA